MSATSITGDWLRHQWGKFPYIPDAPPIEVHWDNVCASPEHVDDVRTISLPTPGSGPIRISDNGGVADVESRWWLPRATIIGYGGDDAGAMSRSIGDFCCCISEAD